MTVDSAREGVSTANTRLGAAWAAWVQAKEHGGYLSVHETTDALLDAHTHLARAEMRLWIAEREDNQ